MCHAEKNSWELENVSKLEKWVTIRKMGHSYKDVSPLEIWVTLKECVTFKKIGRS